jgi:hypothetical protein
MGFLAPWSPIALTLLVHFAGAPLTIHIKNADNKDVDAEILIQPINVNGGRGKSIFVMKTKNGQLVLPAKLLAPYAKMSVEILVAPLEKGKYTSKPRAVSVGDLLKGPLTITLEKRPR